MSEIWILGATGRIGRAVAAILVADGLAPVLIGRDAVRLRKVADKFGGLVRTEVLDSVRAITEAISSQRPKVVLNTIGPFTQTALPISQSCPPGTHYVDLSNELPSVLALLDLHDHAMASGNTFVTGGGFGTLATESVVLNLCEGQPPAARVRCAAIPAVESEPGQLGEALASSITEGFVYGGRRYEAGRLVATPLLGSFEQIRLPDGRMIGTASAPTGELETARRASGAPFAIAASSLVPSSSIVRAVLPASLTVMKIRALRNFARRRIAAIEIKPAKVKVPQVSWAYARVEWPSGALSEGWLRTGDAMAFTAVVMARLATYLATSKVRSGAYTPGALLGPGFAIECGGEFVETGT